MDLRNALPTDYDYIVSVVDEWWGGRDMAKILPRQFLNNFYDTSFVVEDKDLIVGFLIGYQAPAKPEIGYVHFIGVHPKYRRQGIATQLYKSFANKMGERGGRIVKGITSDINKFSQTVHSNMNFSFEESDSVVDGVPVQLDYDGKGKHRVVFYKNIENF